MVTPAVRLQSAFYQATELLNRIAMPPAEPAPLELEDLQGLILRGYGDLPHGVYALLRFEDTTRARSWLANLTELVGKGQPASRKRAAHVAFTHAGLAALGLPEQALAGFSSEFIAGMTDSHRSRMLGDVGESDPQRWAWGGPNTPAPHALLLLFADSASALADLQKAQRASFANSGVRELALLPTEPLTGTEHFGFADGISQPAIEGYHRSHSELHLVKPGEFLLGYPNEYGMYTERPLLDAARDGRGLLAPDIAGSGRRDFGRNGTYLVFRQLRQDVPAFREAIDRATRREDGSPDFAGQERLAAQMIGRWPSGASLAESPEYDDKRKAKANEFRYQQCDPDGLRCPIGAHARRANPRDTLAPAPGTESSLAVNRRHRLLRRGRAYGPRLLPGETDTRDRGLMFIALNANISRQFEFVQHSWLMDPRFNGLFGAADPIIGAQADNQFNVPGDPVRTRCSALPRFVTVSGGAYFFLPSLRALRYLASGPT